MALALDRRLILCYCAFSIIFVANVATINGTFQVLMAIRKTYIVATGSTSNITLDPVNTTATNISTSNTISINCSKTTPHFIGLAPSVANGGTTTEFGTISSVVNVATNTDKVPYRPDRTSATGPVWGNTATDTASEDRVAATDAGLAQTYTAYTTTPSTNFIPDDCADTVTVNVGY